MNKFKTIRISLLSSIAVIALSACGGGSSSDGDSTNGGITSTGDATYSVSVNVSGLTGSGLILQNNGTDDLAINADDTFTFATAINDGASYLVTVKSQPTSPAQTCTVTNDSGAVESADVSNVAVTCVDAPSSGTFTISGSVSGLNGTGLVLQNDGGDNLPISNNGGFSFATAVNDGEVYKITVRSQPTGPAQHCVIANANGQIAGSNISDVEVSCTNIYAKRQGVIQTNLFDGSDVLGIAVGDVNGDDKPDVVTAVGVFASPNKVWFNDDDRLIDSGQELGDAQTFSITLGDIDGDGDLDIIAGDASWTTVWKNDGTGVFTDTGQQLGGDPWSVVLGDIDNDNDLDLVTAEFGGGNWVHKNNGSGVFTMSQQLGTSDTIAVALADVDGDGYLDIIAANTNGQANRVWMNAGAGVDAGTFTDSGQALGTGETSSVAVADIDGDNDPDIVFGNGDSATNEANTVWQNNGSGVFTDTSQALGNSGSYSVALGDIDNDNDADLVVGNYNQPNTVWINNGSGSFSDSGQSLGQAYTWSIVLADMDGDNDLDIVSGNEDLQPNVIYHNDGSGVYSELTQPSDLDYSPEGMEMADIDDDGDLDMLLIEDWSYPVIRLNNGNGEFVDAQSLFTNLGNVICAAFGDIDNDGDPDLVLGAGDDFLFEPTPIPNTVFINNNGTFEDSGQLLGDSFTESIALADVNQDGSLDIIAGNQGANKIWLNDGSGTFSDSGQMLGTSETANIAVGDIDNDNDLDFITANNDNSVFVWLNNGNGQFTDAGVALSAAFDLSLGDVDGDNDLDLVTAMGGGNKVWLNNEGTFIDSAQSLGANLTTAIALGDMDNDGDIDIVAANQGIGGTITIPNRVWLNNGSGTFSDSLQRLGSAHTTQIVLGDIDGDSDLDILAANADGNYPQENRIYRNLTYIK